MWQPPTFPGAGIPDGPPPQPEGTAPQGSYPQHWETPPPWVQGPAPWSPPPGAWWPPQPQSPARRRRSRRFVLTVVAGSVLAVLAVAALVVGAFAAGQASASGAAGASVSQRPPVDPTGLGTDPVLNAEATRCHDGTMQACDDLFEQSDPMSRYEQYGMTCGGRVKPYDVDYCTDLD